MPVPIIPATQEADYQKDWYSSRDPISKNPFTKKGWQSGSSIKSTCPVNMRPWVYLLMWPQMFLAVILIKAILESLEVLYSSLDFFFFQTV
jgi:hypothetical protein